MNMFVSFYIMTNCGFNSCFPESETSELRSVLAELKQFDSQVIIDTRPNTPKKLKYIL